MAVSEVFGGEVFYCGRYFSRETPGVKNSCHSYALLLSSISWKEQLSMKFPRHSFGLTAVNGMLFAIGGQGEIGYHASVESFTHGFKTGCS